MGFLTFVLLGAMFLLPFFLDLVVGLPPERAGLLLATVPVTMGLVAPWAGALADRYGSRRISLCGLAVVTFACLLASTLPARVTPLGYVVRLLPFGFGVGLFQAPNNRAIMHAVPPQRYGVASGLMTLSRTLGQVTGLPLMGAIFASFVGAAGGIGADPAHSPPEALVHGLQRTLWVSAGLALAAFALAVTAWRKDRTEEG
jgi:MFS family permease